jgi:Zn-dependent protease with chaperone function
MQTDIPPKRRLNPFAFPAETNVRFILLILAALSIPAFATFTLYPLNFPLSDEIPAAGTSDFRQLYLAQIRESLGFVAFETGSVLLPFILALIGYRLYPTYIRRKKNLEPLPDGKDTVFQDNTLQLAKLAKVSPPPTIVFAEGSRSLNAQAFGFRNKYSLSLEGGLRLLLRKAPAEFKARVLHELAHIVNGDVTRTYFAQALWLVALFSIIGYVIVFSISSDSYDTNDFILWVQIGAVLAIVAVIRASLLRTREVYADWRAAILGAEQPLTTIFKRSIPQEKSRIKLWRLHPTPQERLTLLQNPIRLFHVASDLPFLSSCLLALVSVPAVLTLISIVLGAWSAAILVQSDMINSTMASPGVATIPVILFGVLSILLLLFAGGYMISGTIGLQVQREAIAEMSTGQQGITGFLRLGKLSALIALGLEIGFLIIPTAPFSPLGVYWGGSAPRPLLMTPWIILWLIGVTGFFWLGLFYARFFGKHLPGSHTGQSPPKWKYRLISIILSVWFGISYVPLFATRTAILYGQTGTSGDIQFLIIISIVSVITIIILYVVAFVATWILMQTERLLRTPHCPNCGKAVHHRATIADVCEHCSRYLLPWLLVPQSEFEDEGI